MLNKNIFSKYIGIKFTSLYSKNIISKNKFNKPETNTS